MVDDRLIDENEDNEREEEWIDDNAVDVDVVLSSSDLLVSSMFLVGGVLPVKEKHVHIRQESSLYSL